MTGSQIRIWRAGEPLDELRGCLQRGGVLGIPTESSYGLAVDPGNREAVESVFRIKGRPPGQPLPVVVGSTDALEPLGIEVEDAILRRLESVWPAALTAVLPIRHAVPASAGQDTLAVRIPRHDLLRELLNGLGTALTATSANRSGEAPILDPVALGDLLDGEDAWIVDGGTLLGGPPSTLVVPREGRWSVLRSGAYDWDPSESHDGD